ncbi:MAG: hypothetical protein II479_01735 [Bacteroidales bacterium]|jgi:hypothetical protein|nr:hypothetical protein [Bacteroidales bacterium]
MKNRNYLQIKTLDELDAAIARNAALIGRKGARLRRGLSAARKFYAPSTLLSEGVRRVPFSPTLVSVLLAVASRFRRRRRK